MKEANKGSDLEAIKSAGDELQKAFYPIAEKIYQQSQADGANAGAGPETDGNGNFYGTDFEDKTNS